MGEPCWCGVGDGAANRGQIRDIVVALRTNSEAPSAMWTAGHTD